MLPSPGGSFCKSNSPRRLPSPGGSFCRGNVPGRLPSHGGSFCRCNVPGRLPSHRGSSVEVTFQGGFLHPDPACKVTWRELKCKSDVQRRAAQWRAMTIRNAVAWLVGYHLQRRNLHSSYQGHLQDHLADYSKQAKVQGSIHHGTLLLQQENDLWMNCNTIFTARLCNRHKYQALDDHAVCITHNLHSHPHPTCTDGHNWYK